MAPRDTARALALGRIAIGAVLLAVPRLPGARGGDAQFFARATGVRDVVMGGIALHTLDHPQVGPRWVASLAAVDAVDALAALAAGRALPRGRLSAAMATGGAAAGLAASRGLKRAAAPS